MHGLTSVDEKGRLTNFHQEISAGSPSKNMTLFTGTKAQEETSCTILSKNRLPDELLNREKRRMLLRGIPLYLQEKLWHTINSDYHGGTSEDDSKPLFMDILRNGLEQNQTMIRISIDRFINSLKTDGSLSEKDADKLKKRPGRNNSSEPYVLTLQTAIRTA